jgi:hypothetical protein
MKHRYALFQKYPLHYGYYFMHYRLRLPFFSTLRNFCFEITKKLKNKNKKVYQKKIMKIAIRDWT